MDHFGIIGPLVCMISEPNLNFANVNSQMCRGRSRSTHQQQLSDSENQ